MIKKMRKIKKNKKRLPKPPAFPCFFFPLFPIICLFLASCSGLAGKLLIMEGNFYHARGMANEAIAAYLKASGHEAVKPYAEFGLGVMYYGLDEKEAALERFSDAEKAVENKAGYDELLYRIHYNTGIVRFENEQYDEAARAFRQALRVNANHVEAKRNLELSLLSHKPEGNNSEGGGLGAGEKKQETETLFDYLRDKESKQWKSREWIDDTPSSGPDY